MKTILVTGGAGFIGSNFVRYLLKNTTSRIVILDKLTYAGSLETLGDLVDDRRVDFVKADICDRGDVRGAFDRFRPDTIVNFAAETHVDRSIDGPEAFVRTNFLGTFELLEAARLAYAGLTSAAREDFRFLHVSTDEVYGSLGDDGLFSETTPYDPRSPYSASKAAADHLVSAYFHTYGLPVLTTNCSNNYGPWQFPEKLIPLMTLNALDGKSLPIYGDGGNIRDWLHVEDHCSGIYLVVERGRLGEKYNIGGSNERTNLQVIDALCAALEKHAPASENAQLRSQGKASYSDLKTFVKDRPGHDRRYAIDATKIRQELGWSPRHTCEQGIEKTVAWYVKNREWCSSVQRGRYDRERLGVAQAAV